MYYILDENKIPVQATIEQYFAWGNGNPDKHVKFTKIPEGITVSTVFLGISYSFLNNNQPILFETMVFGGDMDGYQMRYETWTQAEEGHNQVLNHILAKLKEYQKN